jgi:hypothetical protein
VAGDRDRPSSGDAAGGGPWGLGLGSGQSGSANGPRLGGLMKPVLFTRDAGPTSSNA